MFDISLIFFVDYEANNTKSFKQDLVNTKYVKKLDLRSYKV